MAKGYFGSLTRRAVVKSQERASPAPVGRVGPATRGLLNQAEDVTTITVASSPGTVSFSRDLSLHTKGKDVVLLQQYLNRNGYIIAESGLDSTGSPRAGSAGNETDYFGLATYRAVMRFQKANNLPQTGFFGSLTRKAMGRL